ncbi:site-specific integrase [Piscinibacter gummiphilus]|uniref:Site-specific integrase n=1 Tax=Piscinibacter gummiphilus TaxID=946333 RepID=A0ABZ0D820_9BURK|nr:site-specific integrase [Piscinibacter gummiphilus]WOB11173.1 site-specific integrase [Piscinibacter gummiphilus]
MYTEDLFLPIGAAKAKGDFEEAFDRWQADISAADVLTRSSSVGYYASIWKALTDWCVVQDPLVTLDNIVERDLVEYLNQRRAENGDAYTTRHAWRVLHLVDRVLQHRALVKDVPYRDAAARVIESREQIKHANVDENQAALSYLNGEEAAILVRYLRGVRPGALGRRKLRDWQDLRNLAAVALHVGAGLTAGEVRALPLKAPIVEGGPIKDVPWKLVVPGNGNRSSRETPLARWAGDILLYWLNERRDLRREWVRQQKEAKLPTEELMEGKPAPQFLFPAWKWKQWGKVSHYDAVQKVLDSAGIVRHGGARMLRNTFALRQLKRGTSKADLAMYMGITDPEVLDRYERVVQVDDVVV